MVTDVAPPVAGSPSEGPRSEREVRDRAHEERRVAEHQVRAPGLADQPHGAFRRRHDARHDLDVLLVEPAAPQQYSASTSGTSSSPGIAPSDVRSMKATKPMRKPGCAPARPSRPSSRCAPVARAAPGRPAAAGIGGRGVAAQRLFDLAQVFAAANLVHQLEHRGAGAPLALETVAQPDGDGLTPHLEAHALDFTPVAAEELQLVVTRPRRPAQARQVGTARRTGGDGQLPAGEGGLNPNSGYAYMWHSHTEKEFKR